MEQNAAEFPKGYSVHTVYAQIRKDFKSMSEIRKLGNLLRMAMDFVFETTADWIIETIKRL
jgi:hypothetical protein